MKKVRYYFLEEAYVQAMYPDLKFNEPDIFTFHRVLLSKKVSDIDESLAVIKIKEAEHNPDAFYCPPFVFPSDRIAVNLDELNITSLKQSMINFLNAIFPPAGTDKWKIDQEDGEIKCHNKPSFSLERAKQVGFSQQKIEGFKSKSAHLFSFYGIGTDASRYSIIYPYLPEIIESAFDFENQKLALYPQTATLFSPVTRRNAGTVQAEHNVLANKNVYAEAL